METLFNREIHFSFPPCYILGAIFSNSYFQRSSCEFIPFSKCVKKQLGKDISSVSISTAILLY